MSCRRPLGDLISGGGSSGFRLPSKGGPRPRGSPWPRLAFLRICHSTGRRSRGLSGPWRKEDKLKAEKLWPESRSVTSRALLSRWTTNR